MLTLRALPLSVAILVASQALPHGGPMKVCRYTGEVMSGCPCSEGEPEREGGLALEDSGCCDLLRNDVASIPAVAVKPGVAAPTRDVVLLSLPSLPLSTGLGSGASTGTQSAVRQQGPPSGPLYLVMRTLLI